MEMIRQHKHGAVFQRSCKHALQAFCPICIFVMALIAEGTSLSEAREIRVGVYENSPKVFSDPQLIRDCPPITIRDFLTGRGQNVCEPVVCAQYPEVAAALKALSHFAPARLTGTGACVFAAFDAEQDARHAWAELAGQWQGFVAKGLNTSPLLAKLQQASK